MKFFVILSILFCVNYSHCQYHSTFNDSYLPDSQYENVDINQEENSENTPVDVDLIKTLPVYNPHNVYKEPDDPADKELAEFTKSIADGPFTHSIKNTDFMSDAENNKKVGEARNSDKVGEASNSDNILFTSLIILGIIIVFYVLYISIK